jgi:type IX secretion system PorP/SprF family membrane protein
MMKMKNDHRLCLSINHRLLFIALILCAGSLTTEAQEQFQLTNYVYSIHAINPAFTGVEDAVNLNLGYRRQWTSVEGAPSTFYAGINGSLSAIKDANSSRKTLRKSIPRLYGKLKNKPGSINQGVGLYVSGESFGPFLETSVYATYSFMVQVSQEYLMAFGLSAEYSNQRFNANKVVLYNPDLDEIYQKYASAPSNLSRLNFNGGMLIYGKNLYLGYALHQFASIRLSKENFTENGYQGLHHFFNAGYKAPLGRQFTVQPSAMVKYNQAYDWQVDVLAKLIYRELLWSGISWSYDNSVGLLFGLRIENSLYLGYSYEYNTGEIRGYSQGTHELVLGFRLFSDRISTRFLW